MRCSTLLCQFLIVLPAVIVGNLYFDSPYVEPLAGVRLPKPTPKTDAKAKQELGAFGSGQMFNKIAGQYDVANKVMSLTFDKKWRSTLVERCIGELAGSASSVSLLDLATGTGDVILEARSHLEAAYGRRASAGAAERVDFKDTDEGREWALKFSAVGIDPSEEMLKIAATKLGAEQESWARLAVGDAQDLSSVQDAAQQTYSIEQLTQGVAGRETFDAITMSFGIRNVPDRVKALKEMRRLLAGPSSRVCILELGVPEPKFGILAYVARFFITSVVPVIGSIVGNVNGVLSEWFSGRATETAVMDKDVFDATRDASPLHEYEYLQRSIFGFPSPLEFAGEMAAAGLRPVEVDRMAFGAVNIFIAEKGDA